MPRGVLVAVLVAAVGAGTIWWGVMDNHCEWVASDVAICHGTLTGLAVTAVGGIMLGAGIAIASLVLLRSRTHG